MATLNIKDPAVHQMAQELAERRQTTATGAVREALREALDRYAADRAGMADRLLELGRVSVAIDEPVLSDAELYDEQGLPR